VRARFAPLFALALAACDEDALYPCPAAPATLQGACATIGQRCQWPVPDAAAFVSYCTCAGTGESGAWTCANFRRVDHDAGFCPTALPANGELCDWPTAQPCALEAGVCVDRCDCVPRVGVVTPPTWRCARECPGDAGARDAAGGG